MVRTKNRKRLSLVDIETKETLIEDAWTPALQGYIDGFLDGEEGELGKRITKPKK